MNKQAVIPSSMRRPLVTPEGVDLQVELGGAGARAGAFIIDAMLMGVILVALTLFLLYVARGTALLGEMLTVAWLLGFFLLRNFWFSLFELGRRGATPGKRVAGLRVVARDGQRLTGAAVVARNAMREIEVFLPLSFLGAQAAEGTADTFLTLFALGWSGIFLFFPLLNRDRLRIGDLVAGTWVVEVRPAKLSEDLFGSNTPRRRFSEEALATYGVYELQRLEHVLRKEQPAAISVVAQTIRAKFNIPNDGDDFGLLSDFYTALCTRLEQGLLLGQRRESKTNSGDTGNVANY